MKFYNIHTDRLVDEEEMIAKYGTNKAIPQLGIFDLSVQPDYTPVGYNRLVNNIFYPIQSYLTVRYKAEQALETAGYTPEQATALLT